MTPHDWIRMLVGVASRTDLSPLPPGMDDGVRRNDVDSIAWRRWNDAGQLPWDAIKPSGALLEQGPFRTIEVWTETELTMLHLLERGMDSPARTQVAVRLADCIEWHLEHTQPDNATNRPWAMHAFVLHGSPEAALYAQTLLHNAQAGGAMGDPLVQWILADAHARLCARV
jgi:hypothetical protein